LKKNKADTDMVGIYSESMALGLGNKTKMNFTGRN